ncbi:MAG TPA: hypothetical protein VGH63_11840, partial [Polyangia bacterium]
DVFAGEPATMQMNDLPVGSVGFSAAAYVSGCSAIAGAQPSWQTVSPFFAPIAAGEVTALTLTLEPTGGAVIGIGFGDGGSPVDGGAPADLSPWDMAYTPEDLAL